MRGGPKVEIASYFADQGLGAPLFRRMEPLVTSSREVFSETSGGLLEATMALLTTYLPSQKRVSISTGEELAGIRCQPESGRQELSSLVMRLRGQEDNRNLCRESGGACWTFEPTVAA
jgi:hypothetical protein